MIKWICALALGLSASSTALAATFPVSVELDRGLVTKVVAGRDDPNAALAGPDGVFVSIGIGGVIIFDLGASTGPLGGDITLFETTFACFGAGPECRGHAESAEVLTAESYMTGSFDLSGFTSLGTVGNGEAAGGASFSAMDPFRYIAVVDVSPINGGSKDGFDIDVITVDVARIPLPMPITLLGLALCGLAVVSRRRYV